MESNELLTMLRQPFPPDAISWLPGSTTKDGSKCMAMAYADLRAYQERLDELCGLDWSVRYVFWGDKRIACELTISGVTRSSTGEYDAQDEKSNIAGTVAEAQAFKRAAAMFGLGRYLYELPAAWVAFDAAAKKISKEGQADLDNRYKTWYTKKVAATKKSTKVDQPRRVEPDTGEIIDVLTSGPLASTEQLRQLDEIGLEYYREGWPVALAKWVAWASDTKVEHAEDLSPEQCDAIIEAVEKRIAKRAAAQTQEPVAEAA